MRILAVLPYYAPEGGGLERYAHEVLHRLADAGHDVAALASAREEPLGPSIVDGVHVHRLKPLSFVSNTPVLPGLPLRVSREAREADVVVAHGPVPGPIEAAAMGAGRAGKPLVVTYHAGALTSNSPLGRALAKVDERTLERRALSRAHFLITVSRFVRMGKLAAYRERTEVIPPGVDLERFRPSKEESERAAFFAAPLSDAYRWKGVDVLLEAFRRVPEADLWIAGDGPRRPELEARALRMGLRDRVRFLGRLPPRAFTERMARARVACLPSLNAAESFGMLLAEANACGVPVVASRVGGIPDFVRDGENGLLVPPGDARALTDALHTLLSDPSKARAMGRRGRGIVERHHRWEDAAVRTEGLLSSIAG